MAYEKMKEIQEAGCQGSGIQINYLHPDVVHIWSKKTLLSSLWRPIPKPELKLFAGVFVSEFPAVFINKTDVFTTITESNLFELRFL